MKIILRIFLLLLFLLCNYVLLFRVFKQYYYSNHTQNIAAKYIYIIIIILNIETNIQYNEDIHK